jgi:uroporphyrinogen decarboxylase
VIETVHTLVKELEVPLLAFAGAPFTVASYLIEGRPSRTYQNTKRLMRSDTAFWHEIMERLAQHSVEFISAQLTAGAEAFQVFDSWAGALSRTDYDTFVRPHTTSVFTQLAERHPGVAGIHFGIGCDHLLESMNSVGNAVIGLDWRTSISDARTRLGANTVVQGNLDPALVLAGSEIALEGAAAVLADNADHPGHIFNLGHGVQPDTDPEVLADVVSFVHERSSK